ncbi:hypothetical protein B0H14DRAFT_2482864 [Mycena olivaceomarginata]|nr:hypothetical protein B0H14DRAFT_2482864 [Mycena olivaceomarginata]
MEMFDPMISEVVNESSDLENFGILKLPFEMTAEIFLNCVPEYPLRVRPLGVPLLLAQVCRQWRNISIRSPRLWQSLQMTLEPEIISRQAKLLKRWLSRSGTLPLSISITYNASETFAITSSASEVLRELISHCTRWQYMEIEVPFEDLRLIHGEMPLLEVLEIGPTEVPHPLPPHPLRLFGSCPRLRHIILSQYFQPSTITLCWGKLTHLEGLFLYPEECVEILRQTANISYFKVTVESSEVDLPTLLLSQLESLSLLPGGTEPDDSQMRLLDALTLPSLCTLRISEPWFIPDPWGSISELVARSCCTIRDLHITESAYNLISLKLTPQPQTSNEVESVERMNG